MRYVNGKILEKWYDLFVLYDGMQNQIFQMVNEQL